jgi:hypothetical protein
MRGRALSSSIHLRIPFLEIIGRKKHLHRAGLAVLFFTLCVSGLAQPPSAAKGAAVFTVTNTNDAGPGSLQPALLAVGAGDHMDFEPNNGQAPDGVKYLSHGTGYTLFLGCAHAVLSLQPPAGHETSAPDETQPDARDQLLRMDMIGGNPNPTISAEEQLPGVSNYLYGDDPGRWITGVPHYARMHFHDVYPGIDLVYYGSSGALQYDFILSPGVLPNTIRLGFSPVEMLELNEDGELILHLESGVLRQRAPFSYQMINGDRVTVSSSFVLLDDQQVGFVVGNYDPALPLVIDPDLVYSTHLGGSASEIESWGIAVDADGAAYVAGWTNAGFPTIPGSFNSEISGRYDCFISKFSPDGGALVFSTYLGGSYYDRCVDVTLDESGYAYVTGDTQSSDFPATPGAFDTVFGAPYDAFVAKLTPAGDALVYSTYLGGLTGAMTLGVDIEVDDTGSAYVMGVTDESDFPTTPGAFSTVRQDDNGGDPHDNDDIFITKLSPAGDALVYSTYLGSPFRDGYYESGGLAVDSSGAAYVANWTWGDGFPTTPGAFDTTFGGNTDGFVTKLSPDGSYLVYSTYLGGSSGDTVHGLTIDETGAAYVTGIVHSGDFPTTPGAFSTSLNGYRDVYVTKLNPAGDALAYSTFLGGSEPTPDYFEVGVGIAVNSHGEAFVTGYSDDADFPTTPDAISRSNGGSSDAFLTQLSAAGDTLLYSTYLGGSQTDYGHAVALDRWNAAYVTGVTFSTNFPTQNPYSTSGHAFVTKVSFAATPAPRSGCYPVAGSDTVICTSE